MFSFHRFKIKVDWRVIKTRPLLPTISFSKPNRRHQGHMLCWFNKVNVYWCWLVCKITKYRWAEYFPQAVKMVVCYLAWNVDDYLKHICDLRLHVLFPPGGILHVLRNLFNRQKKISLWFSFVVSRENVWNRPVPKLRENDQWRRLCTMKCSDLKMNIIINHLSWGQIVKLDRFNGMFHGKLAACLCWTSDQFQVSWIDIGSSGVISVWCVMRVNKHNLSWFDPNS